MKEIIFISFTNSDRKKMNHLYEALSSSSRYEPHVVERNVTEGAENLSELVSNGIRGCGIFIPIISNNSIETQWVNQEIGFAQACKTVEVLPVVETEYKDSLKGFVHNQLQLTYRYSESRTPSFENIIEILLENLHKRRPNPHKSNEQKEDRMKRLEVRPYFSFLKSITSRRISNPQSYDLQFENVGEGPAQIITAYTMDRIFTHGWGVNSPKRVGINKTFEVELPINTNGFRIEIIYMDKFGNEYMQQVGKSTRELISTEPMFNGNIYD
jgi:hypothetical protein